MNYYNILGGLPRHCTDSEIKREYRKAALKWHPLKYEEEKREAAIRKFRQISEAFAVLRDPRLRTIFDQRGAKGLAEGVQSSNGGGLSDPWVFNENPEEMFREFFGTTSPFASFFGSDGGLSGDMAEKGNEGKAKLPALEHDLFCSLEELHSGCTKRLKVVRQRLNVGGKSTTPEEKVMSVQVGAGWRAGTKVTFQKEGDQAPGCPAGDVVFTLRERPHPFFTRRKDDLIHTAKISLRQALVGCTVPVRTLDGRIIPITVSEIVRPETTKRVVGEGMPSARNKQRKGDLVIRFDVNFPTSLTLAQKEGLSKILP